MKLHDITLRIPFTMRGYDFVEEAASRLPFPCSVSRHKDTIHVDCRCSAYELEDAYRYAWKELAIRLATAKPDDSDAPDEWADLLSDHAMSLRGIVEQFVDIASSDFDEEHAAVALRALCVTAQEALDSIGRQPAPPPELVENLNLSDP